MKKLLMLFIFISLISCEEKIYLSDRYKGCIILEIGENNYYNYVYLVEPKTKKVKKVYIYEIDIKYKVGDTIR